MLILAAVAVLVVIGGGFFVLSQPKGPAETSEMIIEGTGTPQADMVVSGPRTFVVEATPFKFSVEEIRVKKGDTVKIVFNNKQGMHDWVLDEFNARTPQISADSTETVEFVADKVGTFEYYCSVGNHRAQGMVGKLIVE